MNRYKRLEIRLEEDRTVVLGTLTVPVALRPPFSARYVIPAGPTFRLACVNLHVGFDGHGCGMSAVLEVLLCPKAAANYLCRLHGYLTPGMKEPPVPIPVGEMLH